MTLLFRTILKLVKAMPFCLGSEVRRTIKFYLYFPDKLRFTVFRTF